MLVEERPKFYEVRIIVLLVVTDRYPFVLVVNNEWSIFILANYKATNITLGGIDKVPQDLFFAPFFRIWFCGQGACVELPEFGSVLAYYNS